MAHATPWLMTYTTQFIIVRAFLLLSHPHLPAKNMIKRFCSSKYYIQPTVRFLSLVKNILQADKGPLTGICHDRSVRRFRPW